MKNVEIEYPNLKTIENEVDGLLNMSFVKIPTVHLE
jgi:hypothetical protein